MSNAKVQTFAPQIKKRSLAQEFIFPPFSVLNARDGVWQARKRLWISLGIQSELGRGEGVTWGDSDQMRHESLNHDSDLEKSKNTDVSAKKVDPRAFKIHELAEKTGARPKKKGAFQVPGDDSPAAAMRGRQGKRLTWVPGDRLEENLDEASRKILAASRRGHTSSSSALMDIKGGFDNPSMHSGTSIFDPVLTELAYHWWAPQGGIILDPFAGGSVRGIVAAVLGYRYSGIELRGEQVEANRQQADVICKAVEHNPSWFIGDSLEIDSLLPKDDQFDFLFSCPPYGDLEIYSDDPRDISGMTFGKFMEAYSEIIRRSVARLKNHSFACFVVGDFRDKYGIYRNFHGRTVKAFQNTGAKLYNEAILVTCVGSLPIRTRGQFLSGRKLGRTHQTVLVFVKGDPDKAARKCKNNTIDPKRLREVIKGIKTA